MAKKKSKKKPAGYYHYRDDFFQRHPMARILLGAFIISFAVYLGVQIRNIRATQYVFLQLLEEDIDPTSNGIVTDTGDLIR